MAGRMIAVAFPPRSSLPAHQSSLNSNLIIPTRFVSFLPKCSAHQEFHQLHAQMLKSGVINDPFLLTQFIASYPCSDSHYVLKIPLFILSGRPTIWNSLIQELSLSSEPQLCILLYIRMLEEETSLWINSYLFSSILKACSRILGLSEGTQIHALAIKLNTIADIYVRNAAIHMYWKGGKLFDARQLFDTMSERSIVSWNVIIMAYAEDGQWEEVKSLFWLMIELSSYLPDQITLVRMVTACTKTKDSETGRRVHDYIKENGVSMSLHLGNALMNMYVKFEEMGEAHRLFDLMSDRDVVSWTTMVSGYTGLGCLEPALQLFNQMPDRNIVSWNAMISGYVSNGCFLDAALLFREMLVLGVKPDKATILSVLSAFMELGNLFQCQMVHGYASKGTVSITVDLYNSLIGMYSKFGIMDYAKLLFRKMPIRNEVSRTLMMVAYVKCGQKEISFEIFKRMPHKDIASWNALITVLSQCNYFNEALGIFQEMLRARVTPNSLTLVSALSACARVGALELGKWIHAYIEKNHIKVGSHLASSLIDMYAKCGRVDMSLEVFSKISIMDLLTWSTMISGLAMHGHSTLALKLFNKILEDGMKPDEITFLGVLSACCHSGLVDEGRHYFDLMTRVYNLSPAVEHYSCMVDLFGRFGLLSEANDFMQNIHRASDTKAIWGALLNACRLHGNVELAEYAAKQIIKLDPSNSGAYVLLSNTYAYASRWIDAGKVRSIMKGKGVQKLPGCSSIEVTGVVYEFFALDVSHPQHEAIYSMLHLLEKQMELVECYFKNNNLHESPSLYY